MDPLELQERLLQRILANARELYRKNERLKKDIKDIRKKYDDLRYSAIICPGEAARYYLEECRKLREQVKELEEKIKEISEGDTRHE